jgi:hypothetical protein
MYTLPKVSFSKAVTLWWTVLGNFGLELLRERLLGDRNINRWIDSTKKPLGG